jgi:hypothetical protein
VAFLLPLNDISKPWVASGYFVSYETVVHSVKNPFALFVIPRLTEPAPYLIRGNPMFLNWIPAGVYPVLVGATLCGDPHRDTGRE